MEEAAGRQHIHARSAHRHERPHSERKVVANLGWDKVKATGPVFAGDTLYAESTVLSKRESKSRPTQGIVTVFTRGINQDGMEVMRSCGSAEWR